MKRISFNKVIEMKKFAIISIVSVFLILVFSCNQENQEQNRLAIIKEIQVLIDDKNFEAARLAAIDTLDPQLRALYYEADEHLGHASHPPSIRFVHPVACSFPCSVSSIAICRSSKVICRSRP